MARKSRKNIYVHEIELSDLTVANDTREAFREKLERIPFRGYRVERLSDGREIVITKPGGKSRFGVMKREDFIVWIRDPKKKTLWAISHKNIYEDLEAKAQASPLETLKLIEALKRCYEGEEPANVLKDPVDTKEGETPEAILKAYKWIWGQEDCNYPPPLKGRDMCMEDIRDLAAQISANMQTGSSR